MLESKSEPPPVRVARTYDDLASAIALTMLASELAEERIAAACADARRLGLAAVIVRPSDLDQAQRWTGSSPALGAAIDWPHGFSTTAVKQYAVRDALRRGAREIGVPMNTGKLISRQFQYLEMEFAQIADACREVRARLTIHLESKHLTEEHKIVACRVAKRVGADCLATGDPADLPLLLEYVRDRVQLAYCDAADLDAALAAYSAGCARVESPEAVGILESWKARLDALSQQTTAEENVL